MHSLDTSIKRMLRLPNMAFYSLGSTEWISGHAVALQARKKLYKSEDYVHDKS